MCVRVRVRVVLQKRRRRQRATCSTEHTMPFLPEENGMSAGVVVVVASQTNSKRRKRALERERMVLLRELLRAVCVLQCTHTRTHNNMFMCTRGASLTCWAERENVN